MRVLVIILILVLTAGLVFGVTGIGSCGLTGSRWIQMMNFGYGGIFMWILFALIAVIIIFAVINSTKYKSDSDSFEKTPLDILKERYAKGEISEEEFEKMKRNLTG